MNQATDNPYTICQLMTGHLNRAHRDIIACRAKAHVIETHITNNCEQFIHNSTFLVDENLNTTIKNSFAQNVISGGQKKEISSQEVNEEFDYFHQTCNNSKKKKGSKSRHVNVRFKQCDEHECNPSELGVKKHRVSFLENSELEKSTNENCESTLSKQNEKNAPILHTTSTSSSNDAYQKEIDNWIKIKLAKEEDSRENLNHSNILLKSNDYSEKSSSKLQPRFQPRFQQCNISYCAESCCNKNHGRQIGQNGQLENNSGDSTLAKSIVKHTEGAINMEENCSTNDLTERNNVFVNDSNMVDEFTRSGNNVKTWISEMERAIWKLRKDLICENTTNSEDNHEEDSTNKNQNNKCEYPAKVIPEMILNNSHDAIKSLNDSRCPIADSLVDLCNQVYRLRAFAERIYTQYNNQQDPSAGDGSNIQVGPSTKQNVDKKQQFIVLARSDDIVPDNYYDETILPSRKPRILRQKDKDNNPASESQPPTGTAPIRPRRITIKSPAKIYRRSRSKETALQVKQKNKMQAKQLKSTTAESHFKIKLDDCKNANKSSKNMTISKEFNTQQCAFRPSQEVQTRVSLVQATDQAPPDLHLLTLESMSLRTCPRNKECDPKNYNDIENTTVAVSVIESGDENDELSSFLTSCNANNNDYNQTLSEQDIVDSITQSSVLVIEDPGDYLLQESGCSCSCHCSHGIECDDFAGKNNEKFQHVSNILPAAYSKNSGSSSTNRALESFGNCSQPNSSVPLGDKEASEVKCDPIVSDICQFKPKDQSLKDSKVIMQHTKCSECMHILLKNLTESSQNTVSTNECNLFSVAPIECCTVYRNIPNNQVINSKSCQTQNSLKKSVILPDSPLFLPKKQQRCVCPKCD